MTHRETTYGARGSRYILWGMLLTAVFIIFMFWFRSAFPLKGRIGFFGLLFLVSLFVVFPRPESWLYPLIFIFFVLGSIWLYIEPFHPSLATLAMILYFMFFLADRVLWNRPIFIPSLPVNLCLLAVLFQCVSVVVSIHYHGQHQLNAIREGSSVYLFFPMILIIPTLCHTKEKLVRFLRVYLVAILIVAFSGVFQYFQTTGVSKIGMSTGYVFRIRVSGLFRHHNVLAAFLELGVPIAIALFFVERKIKWKLIALAAVLLGVLSTLYTFSRGGLICLTIACVITLFWRFRKKLWIPVLIFLLFVVVLVSTANVFQRQMSLFTNPKATLMEPTILHRFITYRGFVRQFASSPVSGVGWGALPFHWGRTKLYSFWEGRHTVSETNIRDFGGLNSMFLNQAVKGGLISLTAIMLLLVAAGIALVKALRRGGGMVPIGLAAGLLGFFGHQTLGNQMHWPQANAAFWISMSLLAVFASLEVKRVKSAQ